MNILTVQPATLPRPAPTLVSPPATLVAVNMKCHPMLTLIEAGHLSRECPQPKPKACYTCGQEGHLSSACPQGPAAGGFGGPTGGECYRCGKPGHIVSTLCLPV